MLSFKALGIAIIVLIAAEGASQDQGTPKETPKTAPQAKTVAFKLYPVEENVVQQTNAERARYGLPPLVIDQRLVQSVRAHTVWMTRARRLQHTSAPVAENIAMGQQNAQEAMRSWMSSSDMREYSQSQLPPHRRFSV